MLEMCDQMMDAVEESTAAQRHYNATSKNYARINKEYDIPDEFGGMSKSKGQEAVNTAARTLGDKNKFNKNLDDNVNRVGGTLSSRGKAEARVAGEAMARGSAGAALSRAAKAGYNVKGAFDKVHDRESKKKAIKETCLNILSIIDEL